MKFEQAVKKILNEEIDGLGDDLEYVADLVHFVGVFDSENAKPRAKQDKAAIKEAKRWIDEFMLDLSSLYGYDYSLLAMNFAKGINSNKTGETKINLNKLAKKLGYRNDKEYLEFQDLGGDYTNFSKRHKEY